MKYIDEREHRENIPGYPKTDVLVFQLGFSFLERFTWNFVDGEISKEGFLDLSR
jgi:hypothetical protein